MVTRESGEAQEAATAGERRAQGRASAETLGDDGGPEMQDLLTTRAKYSKDASVCHECTLWLWQGRHCGREELGEGKPSHWDQWHGNHGGEAPGQGIQCTGAMWKMPSGLETPGECQGGASDFGEAYRKCQKWCVPTLGYRVEWFEESQMAFKV